MDKEQAVALFTTYGKAWVTRDPDLILTIFTPDATYNDPKEPENHGHDGIRAYWVNKVVGQQRDISFKLLHVWVDEKTVIAEWDARFTDVGRKMLIEMREVAICTVRDGKFDSLREYYKATKTPL
jgi:uncharacterized protein (TIGR02246 family)